MIQSLAVLLTCHNRKDQTVCCLKHLYEAYSSTINRFAISIYLTDDGSADGTTEQISKLFPKVKILKGNGNLFWAGGMRNSWKEALKNNYDGYLLLNDDTFVNNNLFDNLFLTHNYSIQKYNSGGIYIGSTKSSRTNKLTYGGANFKNKFLFHYEKIQPSKQVQQCDLGNANIMFVTKETVNKIGILDERYTHSIADYDYTLRAKKKIPVLVTPNFCGYCEPNNNNNNALFSTLSIKKRIIFLNSPKGFAFYDNLRLMRNHFLYRLPFVYFIAWLKVLSPKLYFFIKKYL